MKNIHKVDITDLTTSLVRKKKVVLVENFPKDINELKRIAFSLGSVWKTSVGSHTNQYAIDDYVELLGTDGLWGNRELKWHFDLPYIKNGFPFRMMYMLETGEHGATYWADMEAAAKEFNLCDPNTPIRFFQSYKNNGLSYNRTLLEDNHHSGNKVLRIDALFTEDTILHKSILNYATQSKFVKKHKWEVGDLVVWDNMTTIHRRDAIPNNEKRNAWKLTITPS